MKFIILILLLIGVLKADALEIKTPEGGFLRQKLFNLEIQKTPPLMKINYNGIPFIAKTTGYFTRGMLAARGVNTISVSDWNSLEISDTLTFFADVPPTSLKIYLFWDTDNTDLDLHVMEPDSTECSYQNKETKLGGRLDVDVTTGYGPEIYTMEYPNPGVYEIFVYFYGGMELTEATVVTVQNEGTSREKRDTFQLMLTQPGGRINIGKVEVK